MTLREAYRSIRDSTKSFAVMLADLDGADVELMKINRHQDKHLSAWLNDQYFVRRFVGVYDGSVTFDELAGDVAYAVERQIAA